MRRTSSYVSPATGFSSALSDRNTYQLFLANFRTDIPDSTTFALQTLDGGSNPQDISEAGVEAVRRLSFLASIQVLICDYNYQNLDTQYTVGVANGVPTTFISVGPNNEDGIDGFLDIINFLLAETNPPQVLTTSYGFNEFEIPSSIAKSVLV